ncbi:MFS transporter [Rhodococcus sp. NPDC057014]|uniref:MFS transporter n=1 Tax=unclassified Rhodococcus (in: high G+C Gram-positive bacteria) TaxID=192944 RepID=UPI003626D48E
MHSSNLTSSPVGGSPPPGTTAPPAGTADDGPLSRFHVKITALTFGANFSDGYALGSIGIALTAIAPQMSLGPVWQGVLGASMLIGIFFGSVILGWLGDKFGRRRVYMLDFLLIAVTSLAQFFVDGPVALLVLRLLIGFGVGADYALGPTLVAEFVPRRFRGGLLASLTVMWTVGYVVAYFAGTYLVQLSDDSWRWLLASGTIPALVVLILRIGTPESPRWLISKGRLAEAREIANAYLGGFLDVEKIAAEQPPEPARYRDFFGRKYRRNTAFGMLFFNCQVIPYFAIYTFLPILMLEIGLGDREFLGGALLNLFLLLGGIAGLWFVAKMSRRHLLISSFLIMAVSLAVVAIGPDGPLPLVLGAFIIFTFVMSGASNLEQVYPPELFPTELRGSGVGLLNGGSRIGSAAGTFLLPIALSSFGLTASMLGLVIVLVVGAVSSLLMAPETAHLALEDCT